MTFRFAPEPAPLPPHESPLSPSSSSTTVASAASDHNYSSAPQPSLSYRGGTQQLFSVMSFPSEHCFSSYVLKDSEYGRFMDVVARFSQECAAFHSKFSQGPLEFDPTPLPAFDPAAAAAAHPMPYDFVYEQDCVRQVTERHQRDAVFHKSEDLLREHGERAQYEVMAAEDECRWLLVSQCRASEIQCGISLARCAEAESAARMLNVEVDAQNEYFDLIRLETQSRRVLGVALTVSREQLKRAEVEKDEGFRAERARLEQFFSQFLTTIVDMTDAERNRAARAAAAALPVDLAAFQPYPNAAQSPQQPQPQQQQSQQLSYDSVNSHMPYWQQQQRQQQQARQPGAPAVVGNVTFNQQGGGGLTSQQSGAYQYVPPGQPVPQQQHHHQQQQFPQQQQPPQQQQLQYRTFAQQQNQYGAPPAVHPQSLHGGGGGAPPQQFRTVPVMQSFPSSTQQQNHRGPAPPTHMMQQPQQQQHRHHHHHHQPMFQAQAPPQQQQQQNRPMEAPGPQPVNPHQQQHHHHHQPPQQNQGGMFSKLKNMFG